METLEYKERKARKEHKCDYCSGKILVGENYLWSKHVMDGDLYEWKSHSLCNFLVSHYDMYKWCNNDGLTEESFKECINEEFNKEFGDTDECIPVKEKVLMLYDKIREKANYRSKV